MFAMFMSSRYVGTYKAMFTLVTYSSRTVFLKDLGTYLPHMYSHCRSHKWIMLILIKHVDWLKIVIEIKTANQSA